MISEIRQIKDELTQAQKVLDDFTADDNHLVAINKTAEMMITAVKNGGKIMSCGNGGSFCDAMHFAEELSGRFREDRPAIPAISLSDGAHITCVGNDYGFEQIYSRYVESLGRAGDVLLAISTSGNSANVLNAARQARAQDIKVIALTGKDGGKLAGLADLEIRVPHFAYADRIQEIHIKIIHILIMLIEQKI